VNPGYDCARIPSEKDKTDEFAKKLTDCNAAATLGVWADVKKLKSWATICFCDTDNCNTGSKLPVVDEPEPRAGTNSPSQAGSKWIFAVLTTAGVYSWIRCPSSSF